MFYFLHLNYWKQAFSSIICIGLKYVPLQCPREPPSPDTMLYFGGQRGGFQKLS